MKKEIIVSAKSVDEALSKAVAELGAPNLEAIEYTVISEGKKGFLGLGAMPAQVSASYSVSGAKAAYELISSLVSGMGLPLSVRLSEGEEGTNLISVEGEGAGVLIGHHGETLDAIQYLANLSANRRNAGEKRDYCRVTVDVENYRRKREEALRALTRAEAMDIDEIDRALALRLLRLVRYRLEHPDYLTRNEYGTLLLDSFDRLRNELPLGYALFHLPWVLEWYKANRQYKKACELLEAYFPEKPL